MSMDKIDVSPVKNNANNLAGLMFSLVDTTTKRPFMFQNNVMGNFILPNFAPRKSIYDAPSSDRKGKRKIDEIDFFSNEERKIPKLEPGTVLQSSVPHIKEEDIILQMGLQYTENKEEQESLEQSYKRVLHEMAELKSELQRMGEEKSTMTKEINRLNNLVALFIRDNNYYRIAVLPKGHQGNPVIPNHTLRRMCIDKPRRENYQVLDPNRRMPHI